MHARLKQWWQGLADQVGPALQAHAPTAPTAPASAAHLLVLIGGVLRLSVPLEPGVVVLVVPPGLALELLQPPGNSRHPHEVLPCPALPSPLAPQLLPSRQGAPARPHLRRQVLLVAVWLVVEGEEERLRVLQGRAACTGRGGRVGVWAGGRARACATHERVRPQPPLTPWVLTAPGGQQVLHRPGAGMRVRPRPTILRNSWGLLMTSGGVLG